MQKNKGNCIKVNEILEWYMFTNMNMSEKHNTCKCFFFSPKLYKWIFKFTGNVYMCVVFVEGGW